MVSQDSPSLSSHCGFCTQPGDLKRCSRCKVVQYCSEEHQTAHFQAHKVACKAVGRAQSLVDCEEQILREHPGDWSMAADPFTNSVGHFWGILDTRDYMRARLGYTRALRQIKSRDSTQAQLDTYLDMLRLCRSDKIGVRTSIPGLMLQLGKDQEAYDFMKWWAEIGEQGDYDWGDMDEPYMDIMDADAFEPVGSFGGRYCALSLQVAVTLLKIKLLVDLKVLQNCSLLGVKGPREILDRIQSYVPASSIITASREIMERYDHTTAINTLQAQIVELYRAVYEHNKHFWPALLYPGDHLTAKPEAYSSGSEEEMEIVLQSSYAAWAGTPGAIDWVRDRARSSTENTF